ncbi:MAG: hypothetical protein EBT08_06580 [Betaproteobacteria bacterium]|nr:hypothetical protein [Betaproteobacteria bacterium]
MSNRDLIAIDGIGCIEPTLIGRQMRNDLVAKEIKIDPFGRASALGAAQQFAIKSAGSDQIVDGEGEVKGSLHEVHRGRFRRFRRFRRPFCLSPGGSVRGL